MTYSLEATQPQADIECETFTDISPTYICIVCATDESLMELHMCLGPWIQMFGPDKISSLDLTRRTQVWLNCDRRKCHVRRGCLGRMYRFDHLLVGITFRPIAEAQSRSKAPTHMQSILIKDCTQRLSGPLDRLTEGARSLTKVETPDFRGIERVGG